MLNVLKKVFQLSNCHSFQHKHTSYLNNIHKLYTLCKLDLLPNDCFIICNNLSVTIYIASTSGKWKFI